MAALAFAEYNSGVSKTLDDVVAELEVIREAVVDLKANQLTGQVLKDELAGIRLQQTALVSAVTTLVTQLGETREMESRLRTVEERLGIHHH